MPHCARERRSQPVHWPHWDFVAVVPRFCNIWKCVAACNPHFQSLLALFTLHICTIGNSSYCSSRGRSSGVHYRPRIAKATLRERHVSIGVASLSWCHQGVHYFCGRLFVSMLCLLPRPAGSEEPGQAHQGCKVATRLQRALYILALRALGKMLKPWIQATSWNRYAGINVGDPLRLSAGVGKAEEG